MVREFLDGKACLTHYPEGALGPVYGWQWRRFGAPYDPAHNTTMDYRAYADQVARVIALLRRDPTTRRAVISAWNPNQLDAMALLPCHVLYQFWVSTDRRLHCSVYQRSGDLGLGVPFNIASAALLTHPMAAATERARDELVHFIKDAHVYETHVAALERQLMRHPRAFSWLGIADAASTERIWDTDAPQIRLVDYDPCTGHPHAHGSVSPWQCEPVAV